MKKLLITLTLLTGYLIGQSQVIHVTGIHYIDVDGQFTQTGKGAEIGYGYFFTSNFSVEGKFTTEFGKVGLTDYTHVGIKIRPAYTLFRPFKNDYISPYLNTILGSENLKCSVLNKSKNSFLWELGAGILNEYYINTLFSANIFAEQNIFGNSNIGKVYFVYGVGLRIVLNNIKK